VNAESFEVVEALGDWMAGRSATRERRAAAERAALAELRSGGSFDEAVVQGVLAFRHWEQPQA
jgi:hypothetical protein